MSEWQTVFAVSLVVLLGIFAFLIYLNGRLNRLEKK